MIIHFISDSIYTRNFIEFVNSYFDPRGHFFVIYGGKESSFNEFYINQPNCQLSKSALDFILGYKKIKNSRRKQVKKSSRRKSIRKSSRKTN